MPTLEELRKTLRAGTTLARAREHEEALTISWKRNAAEEYLLLFKFGLSSRQPIYRLNIRNVLYDAMAPRHIETIANFIEKQIGRIVSQEEMEAIEKAVRETTKDAQGRTDGNYG